MRCSGDASSYGRSCTHSETIAMRTALTHARAIPIIIGYSQSTGWAKCRPIHSCQARCAVREAIKPLKRAISKMEAELFTLRNMR
jgi:hypothetical protein